jgi:hypothetical protein
LNQRQTRQPTVRTESQDPKILTKKQKKQLKKKLKKKHKKLIEQNKLLEEKIEEIQKGKAQTISANGEEQDDLVFSNSENIAASKTDPQKSVNNTANSKNVPLQTTTQFKNWTEEIPGDDIKENDADFDQFMDEHFENDDPNPLECFEEDVSKNVFQKFQEMNWCYQYLNQRNLEQSFKKNLVKSQEQINFDTAEPVLDPLYGPSYNFNMRNREEMDALDFLNKLTNLDKFSMARDNLNHIGLPASLSKSKIPVKRSKSQYAKPEDVLFFESKSKSLDSLFQNNRKSKSLHLNPTFRANEKNYSRPFFNQKKKTPNYLQSLDFGLDRKDCLDSNFLLKKFNTDKFMKIDEEFLRTYMQSSADAMRNPNSFSDAFLSRFAKLAYQTIPE